MQSKYFGVRTADIITVPEAIGLTEEPSNFLRLCCDKKPVKGVT